MKSCESRGPMQQNEECAQTHTKEHDYLISLSF